MLPPDYETTEGIPVIGGNGFRGFSTRGNSTGPMIAVGRVGALCGCVHLVEGQFWATEHALRVRPSRRMDVRYLYFSLVGLNLNRLAVGSAQPVITATNVGRELVWAPSPPVQCAIAAFLDRKTAAIDALIAKKERLIELLQEKRQALITQAVTKGLDPNVPMKDSGVEWLGTLPVHWSIVPSTWLFAESKQRALDGDVQLSATQKYGVIPQEEFERMEGRRVVHAFMHLEQRKHVEIDDFVMSMRSFEGGLERVRARGCVRSSYVVLKAEPGVDVGYFSYLLKSSAYIQALRATSNFIRDGQDLNFQNFRLVRLPLVPSDEQRVIAAYLDRETGRLDALTAKVQSAVVSLQEFRSALISAAVTGKIEIPAGEAA